MDTNHATLPWVDKLKVAIFRMNQTTVFFRGGWGAGGFRVPGEPPLSPTEGQEPPVSSLLQPHLSSPQMEV